MEIFGIVLVTAFLATLYFTPTLIAVLTKKDNWPAIFALNLFIGWTLIGWVVSLVWALTKNTQNTQVTVVTHKNDKADGSGSDQTA